MKRKLFCVVAVLFCLLLYCNNKSISTREEVNKIFTTEMLLEDYHYLWKTLEKEYPFFAILEDKGIVIQNIKEMTRNQIVDMEPDATVYYQMLSSMFLKLNCYAHLNVVSLPYYESILQYSKEYGEDKMAHYWKKILENKQVQMMYTELLSEHTYEDADFVWPKVETSYDAKRKAVLFRIKSFETTFREQDENLIYNYMESLEGLPVEHIIFDITGNRGGYSDYWLNNLVAPFGGNYEWDSWIYLRDTELLRTYYPGNYNLKPLEELPKNHVVPKKVSELGFTHFVKYTDQYEGVPRLGEEALNAKRWVLIDNTVYSAADKFAYFCKATGWATLVGTKTLGSGGAGTQEVVITLPNTGVLVRFFAGVKENTSGQVLDGIAPDYVSDRYEAPESTLYKILDY